MKVHTISKTHPAQEIAETGALPIAAEPDKGMPHSDKMAGIMLAQETLALVKGQAKPWHSIMVRIIEATQEVRASYIASIRDAMKETKKANRETGLEDKKADAAVRSGMQQVSNCAAIARAFNGGATIRGFVEWVNGEKGKGLTLDTWRDAGYPLFYGYARTFSKTKAGRPADNILVKFGKWLALNGDKEMSREEKAVFGALQSTYKAESAKHSELLPKEE